MSKCKKYHSLKRFVNSIIKFMEANPYHKLIRADSGGNISFVAYRDNLEDEQAMEWTISLSDIAKCNKLPDYIELSKKVIELSKRNKNISDEEIFVRSK